MKITKREIIVSVSILALMIIIGVFVNDKISNYTMNTNEDYYKAVKINNDEELFKYSMDTNVGNALVYGELKAVNTVGFSDIEGEYFFIKKVKEVYTRKTRVKTYTDSKGKTKTKTEVYYEWDYAGKETKQSENLKLLGQEFKTSQFYLPDSGHIKTKKESANVRYKYYGIPPTIKGSMLINLSDGKITNDTVHIRENETIDEVLESLDGNFENILFWAIWLCLTGGVIYGFCYLENKWLD